MSPMQPLIIRMSLVSCILVGLLGGVTPAMAQVLPPMSDPPPGSTLTSTTVTFTGGHASQAGESHWLSVETSPNAADIFHESLGTGHSKEVSGLPTTGTLYVRYWTYTPVAGWAFQSHTYTMNVGSGGGGGGGGGGGSDGHHTLRWDQNLAASERFVRVLPTAITPAGEGVLDKETGLVWEQSPLTTTHMWLQARFQCTSRTVGNKKGWRLPSLHELASLVDPTNPAGNPDLPAGHPFSLVQSDFYWSATTSVGSPTNAAWGVGFHIGSVSAPSKTNGLFVWCVRGGGPLSEY